MQQKFSRDFRLMVAGQIVSLLGNSMLRFALSLYVLDLTGSAAAFGAILALSMVPTVVCSPLGGVLADRAPRQFIMAGLDFLTAGLTGGYLLIAGGGLAPVAGLMVLFSLIQAFYQPSVQASIPALTAPDQRMRANGLVALVQALSTLLGPILGGVLYGGLGLRPMLAVGGVCFLLSAVMELFLRIPFQPPRKWSGIFGGLRADLREALGFLVRDNPRLFQALLLLAGLNLFLSALYLVGLPYLIKVHLGLSAQLYGWIEGALGVGSILGGLLSGPLAGRVGFCRSHLFLAGTALLLAPIALVLGLGAPPLACYWVILACVLLGMGCATLFNISVQTFLQQETPPQLMGKVAAFVTTLCTCSLPLGQAMYGLLFEALAARVWLPVAFGAAVSFALALAAGRVLGALSPGAGDPDPL